MQITVINGWRHASRYWWVFVLVPFWVAPYPSRKLWSRSRTLRINLLGFIFFVQLRLAQ